MKSISKLILSLVIGGVALGGIAGGLSIGLTSPSESKHSEKHSEKHGRKRHGGKRHGGKRHGGERDNSQSKPDLKTGSVKTSTDVKEDPVDTSQSQTKVENEKVTVLKQELKKSFEDINFEVVAGTITKERAIEKNRWGETRGLIARCYSRRWRSI